MAENAIIICAALVGGLEYYWAKLMKDMEVQYVK
jgi:hypothetical protein